MEISKVVLQFLVKNHKIKTDPEIRSIIRNILKSVAKEIKPSS